MRRRQSGAACSSVCMPCPRSFDVKCWKKRRGENLKKKKNEINKDNGLKIIAAVRRRNKPLRRLRANYPFAMCTGVTITAKPPEVSPTPLIRARLKNKIKRVPWRLVWIQRGNSWFIYLFISGRGLFLFINKWGERGWAYWKVQLFKGAGFIFRGKGKKQKQKKG